MIAGGAGEFMTVHHLILHGSQREIGTALADTARRDAGWAPPTTADPVRNRARRRWFERHWPDHYARMEGVAQAFGQDVEDDAFDFSYVMAEPTAPACSAVWCGAARSSDGHTRVGRNLDFTTRTISELFGRPPDAGELPVFGRPYVVETHPSDGWAAIVTTIGDLSGCLDGINEHGLVVALLSDDESMTRLPSGVPQAGLCETQLGRFLLETCRSTEEALEMLYSTKQYDEWAVAHFLVADEDDAFVWERELHNVEHAVCAESGTLCVTNFLLRGRGGAIPPDVDGNPGLSNAFHRARTLGAGCQGDSMGSQQLWDLLEATAADSTGDAWQPESRVRTLWHNQFDLTERSAQYAFYLGDREDGTARRSARCTVSLLP